MTTINTILGNEAFRDFAAERLIADGTKIYAKSLHSSSSECGEDCHHVVAVTEDGTEHDLGEVLDALTSEEMNAEIATRYEAI